MRIYALFRRFFWPEKRNPQTFLPFGCMGQRPFGLSTKKTSTFEKTYVPYYQIRYKLASFSCLQQLLGKWTSLSTILLKHFPVVLRASHRLGSKINLKSWPILSDIWPHFTSNLIAELPRISQYGYKPTPFTYPWLVKIKVCDKFIGRWWSHNIEGLDKKLQVLTQGNISQFQSKHHLNSFYMAYTHTVYTIKDAI